MEQGRISVIVILYFSKHLITDLISNLQQKIETLGEIILINNSGENIDEFASNLVYIIYPPKNLGYAGGINLGVKKSKHEFLLILNPDLCIEKFNPSLENLKKEIILSGFHPSMPGYYMKFPNLFSTFIANALTELIYIKSIDKIIHYKEIKKDLDEVQVDCVSGALMLTNKSTFDKIGGFDETFFLYYEETDFCRRAQKLNIPVFCTSQIIYKAKPGKSSGKDVSGIRIKSGIESSKKYHQKYDGLSATGFVFGILKLYFVLLIVLITPISLISKSLKLKRDHFIYRMRSL